MKAPMREKGRVKRTIKTALHFLKNISNTNETKTPPRITASERLAI
jgi:uncharacterized protein Smg (DUF494 family)